MNATQLRELWHELYQRHENLVRHERWAEAALVAEGMSHVCNLIAFEMRASPEGVVVA